MAAPDGRRRGPVYVKQEYESVRSDLDRIAVEIRDEVLTILQGNQIALASPLECRVKSWESIFRKTVRKQHLPESICEVSDLIGIRVIVPFSRLRDRVSDVLLEHFDIINEEDTGRRLEPHAFGYQAIHFFIRVSQSHVGKNLPLPLERLLVEIQVRTTAQHAWAAASHLLQYKEEDDVPRVALRDFAAAGALLESADQRFENALRAREDYQKHRRETFEAEALNVDSLRALLDELLPSPNALSDEEYAEALSELRDLEVGESELRRMMLRHLPRVLEKDSKIAAETLELSKADPSTVPEERLERGVFFSHVGLMRGVLREGGGRFAKYYDILDWTR